MVKRSSTIEYFELIKYTFTAIGLFLFANAIYLGFLLCMFAISNKPIQAGNYNTVTIKEASYKAADLGLYEINGKVSGKPFSTVTELPEKPDISKNGSIVVYNTHVKGLDENYSYANKAQYQTNLDTYLKLFNKRVGTFKFFLYSGLALLLLNFRTIVMIVKSHEFN